MKGYKYIMESAVGTTATINGKKYLYFAGTGYFNLNVHPQLLEAVSDATTKYGIASATSRAITGTTTLLVELEKNIADFFGTEDAVYLPSGYLSNIAGLKALEEMNSFDMVFIDEGSHYCNIEATEILKSNIVMFKNRNINDLNNKIQHYLKPKQRPLIVSDGLFPIRAKLAPVDEYLQIAEKFDGLVWIDDAHGVGILGKNGKGTYEHFNLNSNRLFFGATLSKAFGAYGGIIPGKAGFIRKVRSGTVLTGSSSPMNAAVAAASKGIEIVKANPQMREMLRENAKYLKDAIKQLGIKVDDNDLPIIAFELDDLRSMEKLHKSLMDSGIYIQLANYNGSGKNGILRMVVFSTHTKDQIDRLIEALRIAL